MISNILRRLRESRINEEAQSYEYKFEVPWRLSTEYDDGSSPVYNYNPKSMDYLEEIVSKSTEDFNEIDWSEYTDRDRRTEDCGIKSMSMSFDDNYKCIITVVTRKLLNVSQIDDVIDYLTGQMSDGWGEGFEQREIARDTEESEEWVEGEEDEEGWYEPVYIDVLVFCQFYWSGDHSHPYQITVVSTPTSGGNSTNESLEESEDSRTLWMAKYKPVQFGPRSASGYKKVVFYAAGDYSDAEDKLDTILPPYSECKLLGRAPSLQLCLDDGFELLESSNEAESYPDDWSYWEMPEDYGGPFEYPHYIKDYGYDVYGYIYLPYESKNPNIDSISGYDAELTSSKADRLDIGRKFDTMEDAKEYLDKTAADYLSKTTNESIDLDWHKDYVKRCSIEDLRFERDDIKSKIDAAKSPESIKKWEDLYDIYHDEISARSKNESNTTKLPAFHVIDKTDGNESYACSSEEEAREKVKDLVSAGSNKDEIEIVPVSRSDESASLEDNVVGMYLNGDSLTDIAYNLDITRADAKVIIDDYLSSRKNKSIDESSEEEIIRYDISAMESFKVLGLARKFNNVRETQTGNYSTYHLVGIPEELADIIDYCKSKGVKLNKSKVTPKDMKWYNTVKSNLTESSEDIDSIANEIRMKVKEVVKKFMMSPRIGFPEDEVDDYSRVDVEYLKDNEYGNTFKVEVRAELSYNPLSDLCDELNPIVYSYDKDSYFEPEQPGIIVAYLSLGNN